MEKLQKCVTNIFPIIQKDEHRKQKHEGNTPKDGHLGNWIIGNLYGPL